MAWFSGQYANYRNLLSLVAAYSTASNLLSAAVVSGGTGYVVGDVLTLSGGTSTTAASVEVAAVSSGVVTAVRVVHAGAYSVVTTNPTSTTGGTGTGCTLNPTYQSAQWTSLRDAKQIFLRAPGSITAIGSGYVVNDIVTVNDASVAGTTSVTAATLRVTAIDGSGGVTALSVETLGEYTAVDEATAHPVTGGTGTGLELILLAGGEAGQDQLILRGLGSGSDEVFVGFRTYSVGASSANNWELAGMTGFDSGALWENQSGISPGRYEGSSNDGGCFYPLRTVTSNFWMSINGRRIIVITEAGSNFHSAFLGFIDPLTTSTAYPYPMLVMGMTSDPSINATSSSAGLAGLPDPASAAETDSAGPGMLRTLGGGWKSVRNAYASGSSLVNETNFVCTFPSPALRATSLASEDLWGQNASNSARFDDNIIERSPGATPNFRIEPTPNTGGALTLLIPLTLVDFIEQALLGQVPDIFWASASRDGASSAISGDTFTLDDGTRYRFFQNASRSEVYNFFAIREA
jgi:hypothetical protein